MVPVTACKYQSSSKLIPYNLHDFLWLRACTSKIFDSKVVQCVQKSIGRLLVEPIKIIPCKLRLKLFSVQFQMSYASSGRPFFFFFWFCVVALWSVVMMDGLQESVLFSFRIILFFNNQILIMLHLTTEFFVFFLKSSCKISTEICIIADFFPKSSQVLRNQCIWEHWAIPIWHW